MDEAKPFKTPKTYPIQVICTNCRTSYTAHIPCGARVSETRCITCECKTLSLYPRSSND